MDQTVNSVIAAWREVLGVDAVMADTEGVRTYTGSLCGVSREVPCVLRSDHADAVREIVRIANTFKTPLYPVSCGAQWGMGSRLPVRDGAAIVDLLRMNCIIEVNETHHYAVVEPGGYTGTVD